MVSKVVEAKENPRQEIHKCYQKQISAEFSWETELLPQNIKSSVEKLKNYHKIWKAKFKKVMIKATLQIHENPLFLQLPRKMTIETRKNYILWDRKEISKHRHQRYSFDFLNIIKIRAK